MFGSFANLYGFLALARLGKCSQENQTRLEFILLNPSIVYICKLQTIKDLKRLHQPVQGKS